MDESSRSEEASNKDSASELPPSRIHSKMPLHKKVVSTSQQGANLLVNNGEQRLTIDSTKPKIQSSNHVTLNSSKGMI
jgi:hypothetical protein